MNGSEDSSTIQPEARPRPEAGPAADGAVADGAVINVFHLADSSADGIVIFDSEGTYLFVNRRAERILSMPRADLLGRKAAEFQNEWEETSGVFLEHLSQAIRDRLETSHASYSSSLGAWLHVRHVPCSEHKSASGDEHGVTVYFHDVTALLIGERRREESARQFRVMANTAPVLIWTSGADGKCSWLNESWLRFTGRTMADELGDGWLQGIHPDDLDDCLRVQGEALAARRPFTSEYLLRRYDGQYRWLLDNGAPLIDSDGTFGGYIGSCVDITEQRNVAVRQRRFVREMLASVTEGKLCLCESAHDLPKPLTAEFEDIDLTPTTIRALRKRVEAVAETVNMSRERTQDLVTAVGEAGMNAVRHGGGGTGRVLFDRSRGAMQVWIQDRGKGIREEDLHRATLEKGWSGAESFGHGFYLMLRTVDRTYLMTSAEGTTIVLEQERTPPKPTWLDAANG